MKQLKWLLGVVVMTMVLPSCSSIIIKIMSSSSSTQVLTSEVSSPISESQSSSTEEITTSSILTSSSSSSISSSSSSSISSSMSSSSTSSSSSSISSSSISSSMSSSSTSSSSPSSSSSSSSYSGPQPLVPTNLSLLQDEILRLGMNTVGMPSTGEVNVLVFVVSFPDYPAASSPATLDEIDKAFNGDTEDTSFESLHSFYAKSSFGKLDINADIYGFYEAENNSRYYERYYDTGYPDSDIIDEVMTYYNNQIDYSEYDSNEDGAIDGLYILYTTPISYSSGSDLWWAYQYYYYNDSTYDGVVADYFVWAGADFINEGNEGINARTYIHETGHMLGLDDYYDYDDSDNYNSGGLGGADMMDYTVGDHNPFSKLILGWIDPLVVTQSMEVDLLPYIESGQALLIMDQWNGTLFDEYLLVTYYTPTGWYGIDQYYYFSIPGVIIYHIDARDDNGYNENLGYYSIFNYNNTDTSHKLIQIVEADGDDTIESTTWVENDDLFQVGDVFRQNTLSNYQWYITARNPMNFTIAITAMDNLHVHLDIRFS